MNFRSPHNISSNRSHAAYGSASTLVLLADLLAIVLSLFVMLFAMKVIDNQKWGDLIEGTGGTYIDQPDVDANRPIVPQRATLERAPVTEDTPSRRNRGLRQLQVVLMNRLEASRLDTIVSVRLEGDALKMAMSTSDLFKGRTADINARGAEVLSRLSENIADVVTEIRVVNHTSPGAVDGRAGYIDLYALSLSRASAFGGAMNEVLPDLKVEAIGYANRQFSEFGRDKSLQERYDQAEQMEIIILADQVR